MDVHFTKRMKPDFLQLKKWESNATFQILNKKQDRQKGGPVAIFKIESVR